MSSISTLYILTYNSTAIWAPFTQTFSWLLSSVTRELGLQICLLNPLTLTISSINLQISSVCAKTIHTVFRKILMTTIFQTWSTWTMRENRCRIFWLTLTIPWLWPHLTMIRTENQANSSRRRNHQQHQALMRQKAKTLMTISISKRFQEEKPQKLKTQSAKTPTNCKH